MTEKRSAANVAPPKLSAANLPRDESGNLRPIVPVQSAEVVEGPVATRSKTGARTLASAKRSTNDPPREELSVKPSSAAVRLSTPAQSISVAHSLAETKGKAGARRIPSMTQSTSEPPRKRLTDEVVASSEAALKSVPNSSMQSLQAVVKAVGDLSHKDLHKLVIGDHIPCVDVIRDFLTAWRSSLRHSFGLFHESFHDYPTDSRLFLRFRCRQRPSGQTCSY